MVSSSNLDWDASVLPDRSEEVGVPSRPSSRLDFNIRHDSDVLKSNPSTQTMDLNELRLVKNFVSMTSAPPLSPSASERSSSNTDKGTVPYLPVEDVAHPSNARGVSSSSGAVRSKPTSVSRLCFPFVKTSKKASPLTPPPRHKHSCFPTKLSPYPSERPAPVHKRHNYNHRGHSRLALDYVKWFWSVRDEEWRGAKGNNASKMCVTIPPTVHPARMAPLCDQETSVPISINPRRGDIYALRDPDCVQVDRSLMVLPSWTIAKSLWMYDLLTSIKRRPRLQISWDEDASSDTESDFELDMSRSTSCSSDSEGTLVDINDQSDYFYPTYSSTSTTPAISPLPSPSPSQQHLDQMIQGSSTKALLPKIHYQASKLSRATDWYNRWETLETLLQTGIDGRPKFSNLTLSFRSSYPL